MAKAPQKKSVSSQKKAISPADKDSLPKKPKTATAKIQKNLDKPTKAAALESSEKVLKNRKEQIQKSKSPSSRAKPNHEVRQVQAVLVDDEDQDSGSGPVAPDDLANAEESSEFEKIEPEILDKDSSETESIDDSKALAPVSETGLSTTDPLILYLNEIRRYSVLTKEQEFEIAKKYFETKDPLAAQELIKSNLRFVVKVAAEYSRFGAKMIDLIQEGNVGLMHAVKEFNPYKGARLITYAVWWIRGYIQEYLMKQFSMVKIGTTPNQRKLFYQLQKQKEELERLGHEGVEALSQKLGIPLEEVENMQNRLTHRDVSLDKPLNANGDMTLQDVHGASEDTPMDERLAQNEMIELLKTKIEDLRPHLNEREKIILEERLLNDEPLTLQEIGEKYGITREAVRQAEARLMKKIRERMGVTD